ncbi:MAG: CDP-glycerol glycerophosphotransferase family protein [Atopobiaceae bacterium]|nr:CDP-glycerol glycerophosphotransferase family protein [Atopobiaceae bacterium]
MIASQLSHYIDPGTGSMLFTLLIGLISAGYFFFRNLAIKARFVLSGGHVEAQSERLPIVIFSDDKRYWNVFKPICDELERRGIDAAYWTASPDDAALEEAYEHISCEFIGEGNKAFAKLNMMKADICLATTPGLDVYQWKRSEDVSCYAHILHATSTAAWYRMFGLDFFDAVLLSNDFQIGEVRELEEKRGESPKELVIVGCSYMDSMAERLAGDPAQKKADSGDLTVLLAPTWGPNGLLKRYGARLLESLIATGFNIIVRPHPQSMKSERDMMDDLMSRFPESERFSWNFDRDNYEVLRDSDIMISDMSGVIHDFALVFGKPVIYALGGIDTSPFDAAWLDTPFWESALFTDTGVPIDESQFDDMRSVIERTLEDLEVRARLSKARDEGWQCRGECAQRTVDWLVAKRAELASGEAQDDRDRRERSMLPA